MKLVRGVYSRNDMLVRGVRSRNVKLEQVFLLKKSYFLSARRKERRALLSIE
jgi:hypothetical protein